MYAFLMAPDTLPRSYNSWSESCILLENLPLNLMIGLIKQDRYLSSASGSIKALFERTHSMSET